MAAPRPARATHDGVPTHGRVLVVEARFYDDLADEAPLPGEYLDR